MANIKYIMILIIFIGLTIIIVDITRKITMQKCPKPEIMYKYVSRTFEEEQTNPITVSEIFKGLFNDPSPWLQSIGAESSRPLKY